MTLRMLIPFIVFVVIGGFLWRGLYLKPTELSSALVGRKIPEFKLPSLENQQHIVTQEIFKDKIMLATVWASWCSVCQEENKFLLQLAQNKELQLIGINYKDDPSVAKQWINKFGNPFQLTVLDQRGKLALDLGVYGTPETFLIDTNGIIRYRHAGPLTEQIWKKIFIPHIKNLVGQYSE